MAKDSDILQSDIVRTAVRGWEANLRGRSPVEQALTRAVVVGHRLLGVPVEPPDAERMDEAFNQLDAAQPGLFATWENSRGTWLNLSAAPPEVAVEALRTYLLQASGTHDPQNLGLAKVLVSLTMENALSSLLRSGTNEAHASVAVAFLIDGACQAEAGYVELAAEDLDHAIEVIAEYGHQFPVPEAVPTVLAVCRETRKQVHGDRRRAERLRRWQYKQDEKATELIRHASARLHAGEHDQAREQIELAMAIQQELAEALPGHPATHELDAYLHQLRAMILYHSGQAHAAARDARRSLRGYQRLTTYDREQFAEQLDIAHGIWAEITVAAAGSG